MPPLEIEKAAIGLIESAGETVKEIISLGASSKGSTVIVFINESGKKMIAENSDSGIEIFEHTA